MFIFYISFFFLIILNSVPTEFFKYIKSYLIKNLSCSTGVWQAKTIFVNFLYKFLFFNLKKKLSDRIFKIYQGTLPEILR